ncbi:hypothetical protein LCGC14_1986770 [marine sediment metagenome]|uniref:Uncharacterized protein n=1 Tax=marine sediment metagenome TaxID=412755 RepID=A0A0F9F7G3_9ZZZZ
MNKEYKVIHTCKSCGDKFEVDQGSRQQHCDPCIAKKVTHKT